MNDVSRVKPWWRYKRVWLIAGVGWVVALVNCVAFVAASLNDGSDSSTAAYAQTCEDVTALSLLAYETGDIAEMFRLSSRWSQLGCG